MIATAVIQNLHGTSDAYATCGLTAVGGTACSNGSGVVVPPALLSWRARRHRGALRRQ